MSVFNINNIESTTEEERSKPLVMLVDDEIENIKVLEHLLSKKFNIITGICANEAMEYINKMDDPTDIQLIISDQRMPGITGIEFLEKISRIMPDTIRIILTGYSDTQVIIDSINKAKLYKFMTKPFDPVELSLTVERGVEAYQMRKELLEYTSALEEKVAERTHELELKNVELEIALSELKNLSLTDQLTGMNNRRFLNEVIIQELAQLQRDNFNKAANEHASLGLLMIDIDNFKFVNDSYGHDAGDQLLKAFSVILKKSCRDSDSIVRWGGEEFVVISKTDNRNELKVLSERIRLNVEKHLFDLSNQVKIHRTCSIGISAFPFISSAPQALTWQQNLNLSDIALYLAKKNGRNAWVYIFEKNIVNTENFYQQAMKELYDLFADQVIDYQASTSIKTIDF